MNEVEEKWLRDEIEKDDLIYQIPELLKELEKLKKRVEELEKQS